MRRHAELLFILFLSGLLAFCSMGYELLIVRYLISASANTVMAQSLTVGCYLAALGLGAFASSRVKRENLWLVLCDIEVLLAVAAVLALPALTMTSIYFEPSQMLYLSQLVTLVIGFLSGLELPLLINLARGSTSRSFGLVLSANYVGALVASIFLPQLVIPSQGLYTSGWLLALFTAFAAGLCFLRARHFEVSFRWVTVALVIALPQFASIHRDRMEQFYLKSFYYSAPSSLSIEAIRETLNVHSTYPRIQRVSSPYQEIDIVPVDLRMIGLGQTQDFNLFLDQKNQFSSAKAAIYHDTIVHGSINLAKRKPRTALVIGGGDGLIARKLLDYPEVQSVTVVELDPQVIALSKVSPLADLNDDVYSDPRVHVEVADGFDWLRRSQSKFDAIFIDLPHPTTLDLSRLYSVEFYRFVRRSLASDGFMVFDFPFYGLLSEEKGRPAIASLTSAIDAAGFTSRQAFGYWESFMVATPEKSEFSFDYETLGGKIQDMSVSNMALVDLPNETAIPNTLFRPTLLGWSD